MNATPFFCRRGFSLLLALFLLHSLWSCNHDDGAPSAPDVAIDSAILLAEEAYIYGIPLVTMDITKRQATNTLAPIVGQMEAPLNQFSHLPIFPGSDFTSVVRPNADTFYSNAWLDLSQGPVKLSLPTNNDRYHLLPMLDAYTNVIASPGTRTIGNKGGEFLITGPSWTGTIPSGTTQIKSPTNTVWIIGRTEVKSEEDGRDFVYPLIKQYTLTPPEGYQVPPLEPNLSKEDPNTIVEHMPIEEFFNYMNRILKENPPLAQDAAFIKRINTIGIGEGLTFTLENFTAAEQEVIKNIPTAMTLKLDTRQNELPIVNGWAILEDTGDYGTDYFHRAYVTRFGLGANLPEDAIYPTGFLDSENKVLLGTNSYVLRFEKDKLPPAHAFWSLTLYNSSGFFFPNDLDRFTLGDRSDLVFNADGSLEIYIQNENPGPEKEKNWLPAPLTNFSLTLRVYYPKKDMLDGTWKTPPFTRVP
ncbi:DUF1254 domain-containing protein [Myroides sp. C15-4]|uniref:DUF1254 domain-containing protein n=1 Tax=Myroides sp. C15-4 TaxID=3400532 RepID=UPI003D2F90EA